MNRLALALLLVAMPAFGQAGAPAVLDPVRFAALKCVGDDAPFPESCLSPGAKTISVATFKTGGSGTPADPWTGWEAAFNGIGPEGASIVFAPGHYREDAAVTLPVNLLGWVLVRGHGATVQLTAAAPRFLTPNVTADHQTVRNIRIQDLAIDATLARGKNHVIFGDYVNGSTLNGFRRVNWDQIVVKRVRAYGLTVDPTTKTHLGGINLSSVQAGDAESTANTSTNIYLEDVRIEGGNWGILVDGGGPGVHTNIDIDNVWLVRCWHSLMSRPSSSFPSSNFQVGERGRVGHVFVIDSYGQFSADSGLELNNTAHGLVTGTTIEDSLIGGFYYVNYTVPGETPQVTWDRCRAAVTGSLGTSEHGSGWYIPVGAHGIPPGGDFVVSNSSYTRAASSFAKGGAALSMTGAHGSLALTNDDFSWSNADLDAGAARLVQLDPSDDFKLAIHGAKLTLSGTRDDPQHGLALIALTATTPWKALTLDVNDVQASASVVGTTVPGSIAGIAIAGSKADTITGSLSNSRFASSHGDTSAAGVTIDMAGLGVAGTLDLTALDGGALTAGGRTVRLVNPPPQPEQAKVRMSGVIDPPSSEPPEASKDRPKS
jgi:hypothetical protein